MGGSLDLEFCYFAFSDTFRTLTYVSDFFILELFSLTKKLICVEIINSESVNTKFYSSQH